MPWWLTCVLVAGCCVETRDSLSIIITISLTQIVPLARKGKITIDELPLPSDKTADQCFAQFNANWEAALAANKDSSKSPSLLKV